TKAWSRCSEDSGPCPELDVTGSSGEITRYRKINLSDALSLDDFLIIKGDALHAFRTLPAQPVQCAVTSPPYWGLHDYGIDGQIGSAASKYEDVKGICNSASVKRVKGLGYVLTPDRYV
ncbi:MAG: hypothetical protein B6D68_03745, partial [spirochete symbiont of Stewartia floridana]